MTYSLVGTDAGCGELDLFFCSRPPGRGLILWRLSLAACGDGRSARETS
jgi:hypothetical protein